MNCQYSVVLYGFVAFLLPAGCSALSQDDGYFEYCSAGERIPDTYPIIFDLNEKTVEGSDSRASLKIMENSFARGFVSPFPLSLPFKQTIEKGMAADWTHGDFHFSMSTPRQSTKTVVIDARPLDEEAVGNWNQSAKYSSVFYSSERGVIAMSWEIQLEDIALVNELVLCGREGFHAEDLK